MSFRRVMSIGVLAATAVVLPALPGQATPNTGSCDGSYPTNAPVVTIQVSARTLTAGQSATAFGNLRKNACGIRDARVQIQRQRVVNGSATGGWLRVATATTGRNGLYSAGIAPLHNELLRAVFSGGGGFAAAPPSRSVGINVRTAISENARSAAGCKIIVRGAVKPSKFHHQVNIQARAPRGQFDGWRSFGHTLTDGTGHYAYSRTTKCGRVYNLSALIGQDSTNLAGRSATVYHVKSHK